MELKLPDLGEGVVEGEIVKWLVKPGDMVAEDQMVLEIMTDKATVEIPTKLTGKVSEICFKEGEIAKVGAVVMRLEGDGKAKASPAAAAPKVAVAAPAPAAAKVSAPAYAAPVVNNAEVFAAPAVRKLAREKNVPLQQVRATGPGGRILLEDVERFQPGMGATVGFSTGTRGQRVEEKVPVRGMRRKIVEKMALSKRTAAHFTYVEECDVTELSEFRQKLKPYAEKRGVKVTYMPFITKAAVMALKDFPDLNATLVEENGHPVEIIYKKYYNIGVAVDTDDGLTVPVLKDADCKGIFEIAGEIAQLSQKAKDKKLASADLQEGTFTITNAGNIGGLLATPIINYPEVAIMGVHQIKKRPVVMADDQIRVREIMYLSLSLDHRVVDGAVAARFMNRVVSLLQDPKMLMMELMGPMF